MTDELNTATPADMSTPETPADTHTIPVTPPATAPETPTGPTFYDDPSELPPELTPIYQRMQQAFTKKTQAIAEQKRKIDAYDAFQANPYGTIQALAQQYGLTLQQAAQIQAQANAPADWTPQTWEDVITRSKREALQEVQQQLMPLLGELQNMKKQSLETQLDAQLPEWREYEDRMVEMVKAHPTLANDPSTLLKLALPDEVQEKKAYKRVLAKIKGKTEAAQMGGGSQTGKMPGTGLPSGPLSFDDAVKWAVAELERQGVRRPGS